MNGRQSFQLKLKATLVVLLLAGCGTAPPAEAPAGDLNKIVFASGGDIYTVDAETYEMTRLARLDELLCCPTWSPDRRQIAFAIASGMSHGVYVMDADGGNLRRLAYVQRTDGDRPPLSPVWSPDGGQIDFVYGAYGYGGQQEASSPGGEQLAFVTTRVENDRLVYELYVKNADGTGERLLVTDPRGIGGIDW